MLPMNIQDFICGLMAGWSQIIVGQPLDYIKVVVQTETQSSKKSMIDVAKQIHRQHGLMGFYRGASSLFFGFAFTIGIQFAVYEFSKKMIYQFRTRNQRENKRYNDASLQLSDVIIAGGIVGFSVSAIYCPVEYVKIKKQIHPEINGSSLSLLFNQLKNNGIKNIAKGLSATIVRESIGSCAYYGAYEYMVRLLSKQQRDKATTLDYILSGGIAGVSYWIVSYPIDVIKTKVQNGQSYQNALKQFFKSGFRGFSAVLIRSILSNGASFATYQHSKKLFQSFKNQSSSY